MNTDIKYLNFCQTIPDILFRILMYSIIKYLPCLSSLINLLMMCSNGSNGAHISRLLFA